VLHHAAGSGDEAVLLSFLEHNLDVDARDGDGNTALHNAAGMGSLKLVDTLLARNPKVNAVNRVGQNAVQIAVNTALKDKSWDAAGIVVRLLEEGATILDDQNLDDNPAILQCAAHGGYLTALRSVVACTRNVDVKLDGQERALF
jgi:ankyrin repeat protein